MFSELGDVYRERTVIGVGFDVRSGTRVRDDRHFVVAHVFIDTAILEFTLFIPAPAALSRLAECRVIHCKDEYAAGFKNAARIRKDRTERIDILNGEITDNAIKR